MISSQHIVGKDEAERMSYLEYKRAFWPRLRNWWLEYAKNHPDDNHNMDWKQRIAVCDEQIAYWSA